MKGTGRSRRDVTILESSASLISDNPFVNMRTFRTEKRKGGPVATGAGCDNAPPFHVKLPIEVSQQQYPPTDVRMPTAAFIAPRCGGGKTRTITKPTALPDGIFGPVTSVKRNGRQDKREAAGALRSGSPSSCSSRRQARRIPVPPDSTKSGRTAINTQRGSLGQCLG